MDAPVTPAAGPVGADARALEWLTLRSATDGRVVCPRVRHGTSFPARLFGLMGRRALAHDEGLYLAGTSGVHMLFMRFPIDCLFLSAPAADGTQRVLAAKTLRPWRDVVWHVRRAAGVIELPAGTLERIGLATGASVRLERHAASVR